MNREPAFDTLSELKRAIDNNEIDLKGSKFVIDNDEAFLYIDYEDSSWLLLSMHPSDLLGECLTELGIPWENT